MTIQEFIRSKIFTSILYGIGLFVIVLLVFQAGILVGYHKAAYGYQWGEAYHQNFGGPRGGFFMAMNDRGFANPHGTYGTVVRITLPTFVVAAPGQRETVVRIDDDTAIKRLDVDIAPEGLHVNDQVVVIGEPNTQAQVQAKLIRVVPPPTMTPAR